MNQHYVPQVYLKNFATSEKSGKKSQYFVDVLDKQTGKYSKINIKRICSEIDLYTLQEGSKVAKDLFAIEKMYANGFEPLYKKAYEILTNHTVLSITEWQRVEILLGLLQLYPRNPKLMRKAITFHKGKIETLYKEEKERGNKGITYLDEDFSFREYTLPQIQHHFELLLTNDFKERHIAGLRKIGEFHYDAIIEVCIIRNGDDSEFVTSDNPLVLKDRLSDSDYPLERSKEFNISLNKKIAVRLYHDNRKDKHTIYRHHFPNGSAASFNKEIMDQSTRFIITNEKAMGVYQNIHDTFFESTDLKMKMEALRQIITLPIDNRYAAESMEVIKFYLERYDKDGGLSDNDQAVLFINISQLSNAFTRNVIAERNYERHFKE